MDDRSAFERRLAPELADMAGPGRRIDGMAMTDAALGIETDLRLSADTLAGPGIPAYTGTSAAQAASPLQYSTMRRGAKQNCVTISMPIPCCGASSIFLRRSASTWSAGKCG